MNADFTQAPRPRERRTREQTPRDRALQDDAPHNPPPRTREVEFFSATRPNERERIRLHGTLYLPSTAYLPRPSAGSVPEAVPERRSPGLVVAHGAGSQAVRHSEFCLHAADRGFVALALDFRGHGLSDGRADGPLEDDVLAAAAFLRAQPEVDPETLAYRGSSMGGFYGLKAAATPVARFKALVLLCPASETLFVDAVDKGEDFSEDARWDRTALRAYFEQQDSSLLAACVRPRVLLVHARGDEVVPFDHSLLLARHLAGETTLLALPGGTHTSAQHDPEVHRKTLDWLDDAPA